MRWTDRSPEVAYSLNPAFCGMVVGECVAEYAKAAARAMPCSLPYLALPMVLHKKTRESMPSTTRKRMHPWLAANQGARLGFDLRARAMVRFTREALIFLVHSGAIMVTPAGDLAGGAARAEGGSGGRSPEVMDCAKKARIAGSWFAPYGDPAEIFRMWGVRP